MCVINIFFILCYFRVGAFLTKSLELAICEFYNFMVTVKRNFCMSNTENDIT